MRHVIETCAHLTDLRRGTERELGGPFPTMEQFVPMMMETRRGWEALTRFAVIALREKDARDRSDEEDARRRRIQDGGE